MNKIIGLDRKIHKEIKIEDLIGVTVDQLLEHGGDSNFISSYFDYDFGDCPQIVLASDKFLKGMDETWYPISHSYNEEFKKNETFFIGKMLQPKSNIKNLINRIINEEFKIKDVIERSYPTDYNSEDCLKTYRINFILDQYEYQINEISYQNLLKKYNLSFTPEKLIFFNDNLKVNYVLCQKINLGLYPVDLTFENIKTITDEDLGIELTEQLINEALRLYIINEV